MSESGYSDAEGGNAAAGRFREFFTLSSEEQSVLSSAFGPPQTLPKDHVLRRDGADPAHLFLLVEGWATASVPLTTGRQQIVKLHLPTDILGAPSLCLTKAAECLTTVTPAVVRRISRGDLMGLFVRYPRIGSSLFLSAQKERVALMDNLVLLGQTDGEGRIAGMFVGLYDRLSALGLVEDGQFPMPLTQEQIGELVGLSPVHVNRILRAMDKAGLVSRGPRTIRLLDLKRLRALGNLPVHEYERNPDWVILP